MEVLPGEVLAVCLAPNVVESIRCDVLELP